MSLYAALTVRIIIVHFHLRPGGVRRVIELATPPLLRQSPHDIQEVVLASGEAPERKWLQHFEDRVAPTPVRLFVEPAFGYIAEQSEHPVSLRNRIREGWRDLLNETDSPETLVWVHNLAVGRNLLLARELTRACAQKGVRLVVHHHDWWFDYRWKRWPEMRRCGFRRLDRVAAAVLPDSPNDRHTAINRSDAAPLIRHFAAHAAWLPDPCEPWRRPAEAECRKTRAWLRANLRTSSRPLWLLPCRLLRRKNIAEALLLTRWLRPEAWLVTTGGVTSKDEQPYADHLAAAVREHGWPLRLGVLAGDESRKPSVAALLAVSECVLLTSVQEGFGLPYLEAAAARRPLIARSLSNVSPDLRRFGFHFPQGYEEILVSTDLFNWTAERRRQQRVFARWRAQLPPGLNHDVQRPVWCESSAAPDSIPFSRLTLAAQIEVLAAPLELSWQRCVALNPFLESWRRRAGNGSLQISPWPRAAARWLSGRAWAKRFWVLAKDRPASSTRIPASRRAHEELLRTKLSAANLYPLLCSTSVAA